MPGRPTSFAKYARSALSTIGGVLLEVVFILWIILIVLGAAALGVYLWHLVS